MKNTILITWKIWHDKACQPCSYICSQSIGSLYPYSMFCEANFPNHIAPIINETFP